MLVIPVPVLAPVPNPELEDCEAPPGAFDDAAAPLPNENDDFAGGRAVLVDSLIPPPALPNAKPLPLAFAAGIDSLDVFTYEQYVGIGEPGADELGYMEVSDTTNRRENTNSFQANFNISYNYHYYGLHNLLLSLSQSNKKDLLFNQNIEYDSSYFSPRSFNQTMVINIKSKWSKIWSSNISLNYNSYNYGNDDYFPSDNPPLCEKKQKYARGINGMTFETKEQCLRRFKRQREMLIERILEKKIKDDKKNRFLNEYFLNFINNN